MHRPILPILLCLFLGTCFLDSIAQGDYRLHYSSIRSGQSIHIPRAGHEGFDQVTHAPAKKLIFLLSPEDCFTCKQNVMAMLSFMERFSEVEKAIVMVGGSQRLADKFSQENKLNVPCLGDPYDSLGLVFQLHSSPVMVLLNEENTVLDFDKCGGSILTPSRMKELLWQLTSIKKVREFNLEQNGELYTLGTIRRVLFDEVHKDFYAIDKTFKSVVRFDESGEIRRVVDAKNSGFKPFQPLESTLRQHGKNGTEILLYDFPFLENPKLHRIQFGADPSSDAKVITHHLTVSDRLRIYGKPIGLGDTVVIAVNPNPEVWSEPDSIASFRPISEIPLAEESILTVGLSNTFRYDSLFSDCRQTDAITKAYAANNEGYFPVLMELQSAAFGLYYAGLPQLTLFDKNRKPIKVLSLDLTEFVAADCQSKFPRSIILNIVEHDQKLWVLYQKRLFASDEPPLIRERDYYFQVFDLEGKKLSAALLLPKEVVPGKIPPVFTFTENNQLCFVTKLAGEYGFSIYAYE